MNQADMEILRNAMLPVVHRTDELVAEMYDLLGSWHRVAAWFAEAVGEARVNAEEGDADVDDGLADRDDVDAVASLVCRKGVIDDQA